MKSIFTIAAILSSLALCGCGGPRSLSSNEHRGAENAARDFAERTNGKFISCSSQDSQNVGYTTCSITDASQKIVELRCTYQADATGCKLAPRS